MPLFTHEKLTNIFGSSLINSSTFSNNQQIKLFVNSDFTLWFLLKTRKIYIPAVDPIGNKIIVLCQNNLRFYPRK